MIKLYFIVLGNMMSDFKRYFTTYPAYHELVSALEEICANYPNLTERISIGKSLQGRDLWVVEVTNKATGSAIEKPGLWIDGNPHSGEVTGSVVCLITLWHLLTNYGKNPTSTEILDNKVIYIMPRVNPDGAEVHRFLVAGTPYSC